MHIQINTLHRRSMLTAGTTLNNPGDKRTHLLRPWRCTDRPVNERLQPVIMPPDNRPDINHEMVPLYKGKNFSTVRDDYIKARTYDLQTLSDRNCMPFGMRQWDTEHKELFYKRNPHIERIAHWGKPITDTRTMYRDHKARGMVYLDRVIRGVNKVWGHLVTR